MRYIALSCLPLFLFTAPADAEWLEASSEHFVIFGDQKEKELAAFAERLERFHAAMAYVYKTDRTKPSPSNRVTVFVVDSAAAVRKVTATDNRYLTGAYFPRAGSSVALIPHLRDASKFELTGETTLYHEYAHHFMATSLTNRAYPRWFVEGFAEFFAAVLFKPSGNVELGTPPYFRAMELAYAREVPIRTLLDFDGGRKNPGSGYDSFYGQSWMLFHYLQMSPERSGQIAKYGELLAEGRSALDAAEGAFGDLQQLDKDLDSYRKRRTIKIWALPRTVIESGAVTMRKLRAGEAAIMPIAIESRVGVGSKEARELVPKARKVADQYPDDPAVLSALAEVEFDAGNDDAAIAAADRALAIDPQQIRAHIQKGYALGRKVRGGVLPNEAWKDVRAEFVKANKIENAHPIPLVQFYLGYLAQNQPPTKNAIAGLEWAMELAPFDGSLRWLVAQQMIQDKRFKEAARTLAPLAYSPHPGENTDRARELLKDIEAQIAESKLKDVGAPMDENASEIDTASP